MWPTIGDMTLNLNPLTRRSRRGHAAAVAAAVAALAVGTVACFSGEDTATPVSRAAPTTAPPTAPPTSPPAPPPPTTSVAHRAHRALLRRILESHHAAGEFVGGRIALREPDGSITEVRAGTASTPSPRD
jgi:hypothetical protein